MATPELVIANAAYEEYPGGVIVLRATDWMGAARGTLSSEVDTRAITGGAVRDTQTVATNIFSNTNGAFQAAADTLVINCSGLPLEPIQYLMAVSVLIEGDWDTTAVTTLRESFNDEFAYSCAFRWYGDTVIAPNTSSSAPIEALPRFRTHYSILGLKRFVLTTGSETLHLRAYAQSGTTIEFLVDQIFLLPSTGSTWNAGDYRLIFGDAGEDNFPQLVDGADGGDAQGKFTYHPSGDVVNLVTDVQGGAGDYQRKASVASAEYFLKLTTGDGFNIINTLPTPDKEGPAHLYGFHGGNYRQAETVTTDHFSRTIAAGSDSWGNTPEGFAWRVNTGNSATVYDIYVDGSQGILAATLTTGAAIESLYDRFFTAINTGASVREWSLTSSGIFSVNSTTNSGGPDAGFTYAIRLLLSPIPVDRSWFVELNLRTKIWALHLGSTRSHDLALNEGSTSYKFSSDFDISSWFAFDSPVGFKIEKTRYRLRVKIWDATGAEPGTWNFDGFLPVTTSTSGLLGTVYDYPYGDVFDRAHNGFVGPVWPGVGMLWTQANAFNSAWDDIVVEYDPLGDPAPMSVAVERPNGTPAGEIEIPVGAHQMVRWGARDWTDLSGGIPYVVFSSRNWNDPAAAELQRADTSLWWMRISRFDLIPMNWRSADRSGHPWRVLSG